MKTSSYHVGLVQRLFSVVELFLQISFLLTEHLLQTMEQKKVCTYIHISGSPFFCVFCVSPSLSQGPSSSGAVQLQFPLSAESTRGRQTPNTELTMTTNSKPPLNADLQRKPNIHRNINGLRNLKAFTLTFSAKDKTVLA